MSDGGQVGGNLSPTSPAASASTLLTTYLAAQTGIMREGGELLRHRLDAVHDTRVATRRFRSTLRVFAPLFDQSAARTLDHELAWYVGLLGAVRDRQVQRDRFTAAFAELPPSDGLAVVAARIDGRLAAEEQQHAAQLAHALDSGRYDALLAAAASWSADLPLAEPAFVAADLLGYVEQSIAAAARRLRSGLDSDAPDALHRARKAAKLARYAVELAMPCLDGSVARQLIESYKRLQDVLGEHQDSVVGAALLARLFSDDADASRSGLVILYAREEATARRTRQLARDLARLAPYSDPPRPTSSRRRTMKANGGRVLLSCLACIWTSLR